MADKTWIKREYFIHSCQRREGVRRYGWEEPLTWCVFDSGPLVVFNEGTWAGEQVTSEVCQDTGGGDIYSGQRSHFFLSLFHINNLDVLVLIMLLGWNSYSFLFKLKVCSDLKWWTRLTAQVYIQSQCKDAIRGDVTTGDANLAIHVTWITQCGIHRPNARSWKYIIFFR